MKTVEFKKALGQALAAEKSTSQVIADLAFTAIDHYHTNSFNRDLIKAMTEGLARRPQLLNKFKLIVKDCTVKQGIKKEEKKAAKKYARMGYAWLKQQQLTGLMQYIRYEKKTVANLNPKTEDIKGHGAPFASLDKRADAVKKADDAVKALQIKLSEAQTKLANACDAANIPAPEAETKVIQDPALLNKVDQLEQENEKLARETAAMPDVKKQLSEARCQVKELTEQSHVMKHQIATKNYMLAQIEELAKGSKAKVAQEILALLAS